jgi:hypothetical protein
MLFLNKQLIDIRYLAPVFFISVPHLLATRISRFSAILKLLKFLLVLR